MRREKLETPWMPCGLHGRGSPVDTLPRDRYLLLRHAVAPQQIFHPLAESDHVVRLPHKGVKGRQP